MGGLGEGEEGVVGNLLELRAVWVFHPDHLGFLRWTPRTVPTSMPREHGT